MLGIFGSNPPILKAIKILPSSREYFFGSGGRIRTHVLSESESDALPLGDTRMFHSHDIYITKITVFFSTHIQKYYNLSHCSIM